MPETLTDRRQRILSLLNKGYSKSDIARQLGMKFTTVDVHLLRLERMGLVKAKRPTELYQLLRDFGVFLAARSWSETDKPSVLSLRERIVAAVGDQP